MKILIRYGEIGLKSAQVQTGFVNRLRRNLQDKLDAVDINGTIVEREDRIFANVSEDAVADAVLALITVPGVVSVSPVVESSLSLDDIIATGVSVFGDELTSHGLGDNEPEDQVPEQVPRTFAVDARRAGEHEYTSKDIENELGQRIVDGYGLTVDLDDPDVTVSVEARYKTAYIYSQVVDGIGGLPVDERNTVVVPMQDRTGTVAAYLLLKRGCTVYPVYTGHEPESLDEDMAILRQFDPGVKLTVLKGADMAEALEQVCDLYEASAVALPVTAAELDQAFPDVAAQVLTPLSGMDEDEVLDTYATILHAPR